MVTQRQLWENYGYDFETTQLLTPTWKAKRLLYETWKKNSKTPILFLLELSF